MFLKKVEITNFRVYYGKNMLDFGRDLSPEGKRIFLIGGLNGAGKTSFLSAITLGLLGQNVSHFSFDERAQKNVTYPRYKNILQENFSRRALAEGNLQMSVKLVFEEKRDELLIERKWWFDERGYFSDEELNVYKNGAPLDIVKGSDPKELKEEFIETKIPPQITKFFFFDGEEIRKIADKDPSTSVREGLNSLLGFAMLRKLIDDLDQTRRNIREETGKSPSKKDLLQAEMDLSAKKEEKDQILEELEDSKRKLERLSEQFEIVKNKISTLTGGDATITREKIEEQIDDLLREESTIGSDIGRFVSELLCMAMPSTLLNKLKDQLQGELKRKEWEGKKNALSPQKSKIIEGLFGESAPQPEPPLIPRQKDFFVTRLEDEWNDMFNPPPEGMADNIIHTYLAEHDTKVVLDKLNVVETRTQQELLTRIRRKNEIGRKIDELDKRKKRLTIGPEFQEALEERDKVSALCGKIEDKIESLERLIPPLENEISSLKQKVTKLEKELDISSRGHDLIETCKLMSDTTDEFMKSLRNRRIDGLSNKMTEMYKTLSHKSDIVKEITINPTTYKVIMKGKDGNELPEGSAGENELFALSMIWGLTEISRRELPFIIDTPLARFDKRHRHKIVKSYFPNASKQVIILSTDTEIGDEWYEITKPYVAKSFLLDFDSETETTKILENRYFEFH